ncbi:methylated-DNA-protein-cysteine methyltransferase [Teredinibacter turnerae T7901]|uniref:Methylated-DNA-protein-cysteine methyltransferase n=1 Tax=Teredinibacter turnerae (strain ATCC 39867 / T7901) TaxID=377629 RepID=C5BUL3_TERTT|nr:MGMT family protein [Teredinibacter turnerae]ACR13709.1 methylated-DNA-protein-cysteine methyltransferase [Teredinibacter turnerae T7901]
MSNENASHSAIFFCVRLIPKGKVASYGQIAQLAGLPGRARLVGRVLGMSPTPLPWFRVLRSNGQLAFPEASETARRQSAHLEQEGVAVKKNRVVLKNFGWQPSLDELFLIEAELQSLNTG